MQHKSEYYTWLSGNFQTSIFVRKSTRFRVLNHFLIVCLLASFVFATQQFPNVIKDHFALSACFQAITCASQIGSRQWTLFFYSKEIQDIFRQYSRFWAYDVFGEKFAEKLRTAPFLYAVFVKFTRALASLILVFAFSVPFLSKPVDLSRSCCIPNSIFWTPVFFILQVLSFSQCIMTIILFDGLLYVTCAELRNQFILLKQTISCLKLGQDSTPEFEKQCLFKLKLCVIYHLILLRTHNGLKKVFSFHFCLNFVLTIEQFCVHVLMMKKNGFSDDAVTTLGFLLASFQQCVFSIMAVSNVEIEAETLSDTIYEMDFYNAKTPSFGKNLILIMVTAQKPLRFSGAGMFDVNRNLLLQILKLSFSIYTLLDDIQW